MKGKQQPVDDRLVTWLVKMGIGESQASTDLQKIYRVLVNLEKYFDADDPERKASLKMNQLVRTVEFFDDPALALKTIRERIPIRGDWSQLLNFQTFYRDFKTNFEHRKSHQLPPLTDRDIILALDFSPGGGPSRRWVQNDSPPSWDDTVKTYEERLS